MTYVTVVNSRRTRNFQTLITRIVGVIENSEDLNNQLIATNGICFLKFVIKSLLEKLSGEEFTTFIDGYHQSNDLLHKNHPGESYESSGL